MYEKGFYHIKIVSSNANYGHSLGSQNFGIRENIEAFPVGTRPLVPMNLPQFKILIFCVPCSFSDHKILNGYPFADPEGGQGFGPPPPLENYEIKGSLAILARIPLKSQSYQSSIQCWAFIGPPIVVFGSFLPSSAKKIQILIC